MFCSYTQANVCYLYCCQEFELWNLNNASFQENTSVCTQDGQRNREAIWFGYFWCFWIHWAMCHWICCQGSWTRLQKTIRWKYAKIEVGLVKALYNTIRLFVTETTQYCVHGGLQKIKGSYMNEKLVFFTALKLYSSIVLNRP